MYESNPRVPIPPWATPGDLTRIKFRVGGNLTFVQVPVPRAFDTGEKRRSYLKKSYKVDSVVHTDVRDSRYSTHFPVRLRLACVSVT